ncbi:hypothetical protein HPB51_020166 [Rhipicephalus microplus]|uniref:NADP-dependent oxidoreductase domain-containing protein n=1 Tax=Rhipicephalus microplus TaxID=6941 RepID=A0A9J6D6Z2_RHIMP|nr:hypothetical protein HPB51_020166 [Rhipicephalus microplus]
MIREHDLNDIRLGAFASAFNNLSVNQALEGISRDSFYVATKVGRYELDCERMFDFSGSRTLKSVQEGLRKMKLNYFDVVQASAQPPVSGS